MQADAGSPWTLDGFDVQELLGYGGSGEVWRAVELATGDVVALKRLLHGSDAEAVASLRQEAAVLRALDTPHVVRLRAVVGEGTGTVLVLDHAGGGSLAWLLARRGALDTGEVVTVAGPLAAALASAHARGVVHGDVTPANVLFTAAGMPMLSDFGLAALAGTGPHRLEGTAEYLDPAVVAGRGRSPASDVWGLAAVCHHMLAGSPPHGAGADEPIGDILAAAERGGRAPLGLLAPHAPRGLVEAVEAALHPDPDRRPDAAAFGAAVRRSHAAAPVALRGPRAAGAVPAARPTHAVPRHAAPPLPAPGRRGPRWAVPVVAAVVLLAAAAGTGWAMGRAAEPAPAASLPLAAATSSASPSSAAASRAPSGAPSAARSAQAGVAPGAGAPTPEPVDWAEILDGLDAVRAEAFAAADVVRLADAYVPGSPGLSADEALLRQLAASGQVATGVRHRVRSVRPEEVTGERARLLVVDTLAAYEVRDARAAPGAAAVRRVAPRGEAGYLVELARTSTGWRLVRVTPT